MEENDDRLASGASRALTLAPAASDRFHLAKGQRRRLMRKSKLRHPHALPMHDCDRNVLPARRPVCNFSQISTTLLPLRSPAAGYFKEGGKKNRSFPAFVARGHQTSDGKVAQKSQIGLSVICLITENLSPFSILSLHLFHLHHS